MSGDERPAGNAEMRPLGDWAGGDRGIAGYEDRGGSDLVMRDGILLGGMTSDGAGRPTIDIHSARPSDRDTRDATRQDAEQRDEPRDESGSPKLDDAG
jgi:hypothetical protein